MSRANAAAAVSLSTPRSSKDSTKAGPLLLVADPHAELEGLAEHGVTVVRCSDGMEALLHIGADQPDILLLGADLPGIDAVSLIATLRRRMDLRIIFGAGDGDASIALQALQAGATACVARPYRIPELLPLMHVTPGSDEPLRIGEVELDELAHVVRISGEPVHVPLREFELLAYLMRNAGRVVTRHEISRHVWHSTVSPPNNTIAVHVKRLRRRIGDDEKNPTRIHTVRGLGYRYVLPEGSAQGA